MNRIAALALLAALAPSGASAITIAGFETARTLEPQHLEAGGAFAGADDFWTAWAHGRIGLLPELDARLAVGFVLADEDPGFEVAFGGKFRFLRTADTAGFVDVAAGASGSFLKTDDLFMFGLDPEVYVSHHFALPGKRELFIAGTIGAAMTIVDVDGADEEAELGLLGAVTFGVDIVEDVCLALEGRRRDDLYRLGLSVTVDF
ncbi:MAG: hypothetical protein KC620_20270 [Myxococcales bacterium]|nr:hypothetical protein [Myxococcales bacterium]